ncbi:MULTISPECIES: NUDIX domain-containing protein [unclassified Acinetobacter]|uniref:NUDIX domain-containing protein n=1 Tax=unclassified Acinetobacter TaxID=196816 RepID=UPI002934EB4D|nr:MULTISPECIES: NUDIX domain-containing protein [unclassified Acinetobacter]WOE33149.1 NUDIX domain-containing protein [Acinetobacter sp. SAAs470]WOE39814.1 NUDIX domain-containing protein [Acinetobacter sp. SAAs474]
MTIMQHASYNKHDFNLHQRQYIYRGFIQVEKVSLSHRLFNQSQYTPILERELIHRPEAAGVILYDTTQKKFALIEQFRIGAINDPDSPWQLEIIAGVLDQNETAETCIRREALEESGCHIEQLQHLFSFYPSAGACDELFHLYAATADLPVEGGVFGMPNEGENIKLHIFAYQDIAQLLHHGRVKNAPVIMALQWLHSMIKTNSI